jgi:hypothetical protein
VIELLDDPVEFHARAGALLESTVRNTVLATVLSAIRGGQYAEPPPRYALVTDGSGTVTGAALRTPPRGLLCTELTGVEADELMERWLGADPELSGVNALTETARALTAAYRKDHGRLQRAAHGDGPACARPRRSPRSRPTGRRAPAGAGGRRTRARRHLGRGVRHRGGHQPRQPDIEQDLRRGGIPAGSSTRSSARGLRAETVCSRLFRRPVRSPDRPATCGGGRRGRRCGPRRRTAPTARAGSR